MCSCKQIELNLKKLVKNLSSVSMVCADPRQKRVQIRQLVSRPEFLVPIFGWLGSQLDDILVPMDKVARMVKTDCVSSRRGF